ncbi:MAG: DUF6962 family protein [Bacteroidia bacterium]
MKETVITIFGHALYEPVTVITNLFISLTCAYFFIRLRSADNQAKLLKYWRLFFFYIGLCAFIGSIAHGFKPYFSLTGFYILWMAMNVSNLPGSYYLLKAGIEISGFRDDVKRKLNVAIFIYMGIIAVLTVILNNFQLIKINALIVILFTIVQHFRAWRKGLPGNGYIWGGYAFSITALIVHTAKLSVSEWFNFKDLSHIIMNITLIILYIGVRKKTISKADTAVR